MPVSRQAQLRGRTLTAYRSKSSAILLSIFSIAPSLLSTGPFHSSIILHKGEFVRQEAVGEKDFAQAAHKGGVHFGAAAD
jgi:hypothetical protein